MSIANAEIQNLLTKEMILFMKQILNNFDEFLACTYVRVHTRSRELIPSLIRIGYDGSISSVIYNNEFWDTIMFGIIGRCSTNYNIIILLFLKRRLMKLYHILMKTVRRSWICIWRMIWRVIIVVALV